MSLPDSTADVTPGAGMMCQAPAGAAEVLGCPGIYYSSLQRESSMIYDIIYIYNMGYNGEHINHHLYMI